MTKSLSWCCDSVSLTGSLPASASKRAIDGSCRERAGKHILLNLSGESRLASNDRKRMGFFGWLERADGHALPPCFWLARSSGGTPYGFRGGIRRRADRTWHADPLGRIEPSSPLPGCGSWRLMTRRTRRVRYIHTQYIGRNRGC